MTALSIHIGRVVSINKPTSLGAEDGKKCIL